MIAEEILDEGLIVPRHPAFRGATPLPFVGEVARREPAMPFKHRQDVDCLAPDTVNDSVIPLDELAQFAFGKLGNPAPHMSGFRQPARALDQPGGETPRTHSQRRASGTGLVKRIRPAPSDPSLTRLLLAGESGLALVGHSDRAGRVHGQGTS